MQTEQANHELGVVGYALPKVRQKQMKLLLPNGC